MRAIPDGEDGVAVYRFDEPAMRLDNLAGSAEEAMQDAGGAFGFIGLAIGGKVAYVGIEHRYFASLCDDF